MAKSFNAATLRASLKSGTAATSDKPKGEFLADTFEVTVRNKATGEVILVCDAASRGFGAKEVAKGPNKGQMLGGVGWYADIRGESMGEYNGFAVSGGLRFSLDGVKIKPSDSIDLRDTGDDSDADADADS